ncbi:MAG: hypothetical protein P8178_05750 [Candidatus Thiodiazotropha sp.]
MNQLIPAQSLEVERVHTLSSWIDGVRILKIVPGAAKPGNGGMRIMDASVRRAAPYTTINLGSNEPVATTNAANRPLFRAGRVHRHSGTHRHAIEYKRT